MYLLAHSMGFVVSYVLSAVIIHILLGSYSVGAGWEVYFVVYRRLGVLFTTNWKIIAIEKYS